MIQTPLQLRRVHNSAGRVLLINDPYATVTVCADMVCPPRKLFGPMTRRSKNILLRVFSSSSSWRSRTILLSALQRYGVVIPYHTLRNRFLGFTRPYRQAYGSQQLLAPEAERVLVDWIHFYSDTSHPLSRRTIRKKAQCICGKKPSKGWIRSFLLRWPEIKLGKPSGLDPKRAQAFNRPVVGRYFKQLDDLVEKYDVPMENLYNMDEKGQESLIAKVFCSSCASSKV